MPDRVSPYCGAEIIIDEYRDMLGQMVKVWVCSKCQENIGNYECHKPVKGEEG